MYTVVGKPVAHSKSPKVYQHLFDYFGIEKSYMRTETDDGKKLRQILEGVEGANITYPLKQQAAKICDKLDRTAKNTKSVNTVVNSNGTLIGYNTDGEGFANSLNEFGEGLTILIMGAGSTVRAVVESLKGKGHIVAIINRSSAPLLAFENCLVYTPNQYNKTLKPDIVVNMTTAGLENEELPFPSLIEGVIEGASVCIDVNYAKKTPFLKLAEEKGKIIRNGEGMLKCQAGLAFHRFMNERFSLKDIEKALEGLEI